MSGLKWFVLLHEGRVVHGGWRGDAPPWPEGPGPYPDFAFDEAREVERPADARAERWCPVEGLSLGERADFDFKRDIDAIAAAALNPRPVVAELHRQQADEARRWLSGEDPDGDYPHLGTQADILGETLDARAAAIVAGIAKSANDTRAVAVNAARLKAKADVRAADSVESKTAVVVAFREQLAGI